MQMERLPAPVRWLVGLAVLVALAPVSAVAADPHAVVFMYHRFGEDRYPSTSVRLEQFESHLQHLAEGNYQVWPLERVVSHLATDMPIPEHTVALSVDDAYLSVYTEAFPRLRERSWPFTVFVATGPVDQGLQGQMSWAQMREMQAAGVTFANHGVSHAYLIRRHRGESEVQWRVRMRDEIETAQRRLVEELGAAPPLFAYPYGEYDEPLANLVRELGYTAFGQQSGAVGRYSDPRALPRFPMAESYAELQEFAAKARMRALPVVAHTPWDPVLEGTRRPELVVTLGDGQLLREELACFVSGQGSTPVRWLDAGRNRFAIQAREDLPPGRSRYNCTVPDRQRNYYWFSQQWVRSSDR
ncbi:MAG: polysaccharide deacetylase family protein [Deferrisomatales bacterium]|nr:polysaccharide deacetylase family protein [Deferrisomatales bacterium]